MTENEDLTRRQGPVADAPASHNLAESGAPPAVPALGADAITGILDDGAKSAESNIGSIAALGALVRTMVQVAPWRLGWTIALTMLFSLTEGVGVALLFPTLEAAGFSLENQGKAGHYAKVVGAAFSAVGLPRSLLLLLSLYVAVIAARTLIDRARNVSDSMVHRRVEDVMRRRLYSAISNTNWLFITRNRFSDFNHALTAEMERVTTASSFLTLLVANLVMGLLYVGLALALSVPMTLMVLGFGALMTLALYRRTHKLEELGTQVARYTNRLYAAASEHLQGLKTVKTYNAEKSDFEIFSKVSGQIAHTYIETEREQAAVSSWFELGSALALGVVLYVAIIVLAVPPAVILILVLLFARVMPRFQSSHYYYRTVVNALPSFVNVCALEQRCLAAAEAPARAQGTFAFAREIRLERVSFTYREDARPALRGVDMVIPAGKITAIVGPSGAGKSTIADLVLGLIQPAQGRITIDETTLTPEAVRAWRNRLGYVAQETALFNLSVRENLLWARPDASEAELNDALGLAAADEFTRALAQGLDTIVGERGALLSQGERQRLAIARALLRRPQLLVLDEATNSLDYENEARVLDAIDKLRPEITVLIIAHRLSTIRWADLIYVVEDGTVIESGRWDELNVRRGGRFRALCESQKLVA
jgi:ATP-binding cassette, subfamily C, bacterial